MFPNYFPEIRLKIPGETQFIFAEVKIIFNILALSVFFFTGFSIKHTFVEMKRISLQKMIQSRNLNGNWLD